MKTLKWIAVTALLAGSSTIALAQGPGIDSEGNVLPPQYNGGMNGYGRGYYDYARPRNFNTAQPESPYRYRYRYNDYR